MARDYAAFRAKVERERKVWLLLAVRRRDGILTADDYDEGAYQYHLYVQWQCDEQTRWLRDEAKKNRRDALSRLPSRRQSRRLTMSGASGIYSP